MILGIVKDGQVTAGVHPREVSHSTVYPSIHARWRQYEETPTKVHWTEEPTRAELETVTDWFAKRGTVIHSHLLLCGKPVQQERMRRSLKELLSDPAPPFRERPFYSCC